MYGHWRKELSQNFFYSRKLVNQLLRHSSIGIYDTVLDIGTGRGIITEALLPQVAKIIAIEIDPDLCSRFRRKFGQHPRIKLSCQDFLQFRLPSTPYKVFSNIPFSIEGKIVRKLLDAINPPEESCLVVRRDLAVRLAGLGREGQFSISHKPFFDFRIIHHFRRTDFTPQARMDCVFLRIRKREYPLITPVKRRKYYAFIERGFTAGKCLKQSLRGYFSLQDLSRIADKNGFSPKDKPSRLALKQWLALFEVISP